MPFALDPVSPETLKAEARALRAESAVEGNPISHSEALERTARAHGYRDWNTVVGTLREPAGCPVKLGDRVSGTYLKQPFAGRVLSTTTLPRGKFHRLVIQFDEPVDVVTFDSFSAFRQRVTSTVDAYGRSPERTGDGVPHMQLDLPHRR